MITISFKGAEIFYLSTFRITSSFLALSCSRRRFFLVFCLLWRVEFVVNFFLPLFGPRLVFHGLGRLLLTTFGFCSSSYGGPLGVVN